MVKLLNFLRPIRYLFFAIFLPAKICTLKMVGDVGGCGDQSVNHLLLFYLFHLCHTTEELFSK